MPTLISCPSCQRSLNVPDEFLGRQVKCPGCNTVFAPQAPIQAAPLVPPSVVPVSEPPAFSTQPRREEPLPDVPDRREWARSQVQAPAICLLVTGILGIIFNFLGVANLVLSVDQMRGPALIVGGGVVIVGFLMSSRTIAGANAMRKLESHQTAFIGCILAMLNLPMFCCLLGLPFGIWGIVLLNNPDIRAQFADVKLEQRRRRRTPPPLG